MAARPLEQTALSLEWVYGVNTSIVNGVIDLSDDQRSSIFYASAHTGVIFHTDTNTQTLLSGHRHAITAVACTEDKQYVATADSGDQSAVIVWDSHNARPVFTKFNPHPNGVIAIAFAATGQFIVTLSNDEPPDQVLSIWDWNSMEDDPQPLASVLNPIGDKQLVINFNPLDHHQMLTNGRQNLIFWGWDEATGGISYQSPGVSSADLKKQIGRLEYSMYLPIADQAIVSTSEGYVVHLERDQFALLKGLEPEHKPVKVINLHRSAILTLAVHDDYIVTGGQDNCINFYEFDFHLRASFESLRAGPISSISFSLQTPEPSTEKFRCKPFIIATKHAAVMRLVDQVYYDVTGQHQPETLLKSHTGNVVAMAVNPNDGRVISGSDTGELIQWDILNHLAVNRAVFDNVKVSALKYDPTEDFLAVGFTNGNLMIVTTENFDEVFSQRITKNVAITDIEYSSDSSFLAATLADNTLALFRSLDKLSPTTPMMSQSNDDSQIQMATIQQEMKKWEYVGRHRSHWGPIKGLAFIGNGSQESPHRLFTIGDDRRVVEYDFANSAYLDGVQLKMETKVEMTAHPTAFCWSVNEPRPYFVVANTESKLRMWNGTTMICRSTTIAPSFGGNLTHLAFVNLEKLSMIYATDMNVLGLILFPLTGSPNESMGMIAHPQKISRLVLSKDSTRAMICSGTDNFIGVFNLHPEHLEAAALLASKDGDPFVSMLEGGEGGPLYQEIVDLFYSSMLRVQGKLTDKPHAIPQVIPIEEVVPLFCALGYYPTQFESDLVRNEIYYSKFVETNEGVETVDFKTFLKLFLNHRPIYPPSLADVEAAFEKVGADGSGSLLVRDLQNVLQTSGETMSIADIERCIESLVGDQPLPASITAQEFVELILALQTEENNWEEEEEIEV